jgi:hypothetical protein
MTSNFVAQDMCRLIVDNLNYEPKMVIGHI